MLKRNHLDEQRETVKQQAATRASDLAQLRALVSKRRCLMMQPKQQHRSAAVTANSLVEEFKGDVKERYGPNHWSKWMQQSAATLQEATEEHKRHAVQLGRVFAAYQAMLKDSTGAADGAAIANVTTNNTNPQGSSMQEESTTMEVIRKVLS